MFVILLAIILAIAMFVGALMLLSLAVHKIAPYMKPSPCQHIFSKVCHQTVSYSDHHSVIIDQCILCKEKRATLIAPSFTTTLPLDLAERTLTGIDVKA